MFYIKELFISQRTQIAICKEIVYYLLFQRHEQTSTLNRVQNVIFIFS